MSQTFTVSVPKLKQQLLVDAAADAAINQAVKYFSLHRWWWINGDEMIFDAETGKLWQGKLDLITNYNYDQQSLANTAAKKLKLGGLDGWRVPTKDELVAVATASNTFPLRKGHVFRVNDYPTFLTSINSLNLDYNPPSNSGWGDAKLLPVRDVFTTKPSALHALVEFAKRNWAIKPHNVKDDQAAKDFSSQYEVISVAKNKLYDKFTAAALQQLWTNIDYLSARLPKLESLRFTDINQGLWEFFDDKSPRLSVVTQQSLRGRDPALDIRDGNVAIDFGTSSTVVAFRENGRDQLLRIGGLGLEPLDPTKDKLEERGKPKAEHYENPTVLEFVDFPKFLNQWISEAYRPLVDWSNIRCSHEAQIDFRNNKTDSKVVGSVLLRIKQWALRNSETNRVRITDQENGFEHELASLTERNPVKGQLITIDKDYPFDPIELYAWFLGLTINWRQRGLFLHYYMTFPVAYPSDVKNKILSSFRRGLQRSLPLGLVKHTRFNEFRVEERASEPAAFAAAALETLKIQPTKQGTAYAVFDFGGGTTDFDYGFYRLPTQQEENEGWEHVLEHFGASGDQFLGGENLLENMAYLVFCSNVDICRKHEIAFSKPLDAKDFAGSEMLLAKTQAAITNTTMMMSHLRALWEKGEANKNAQGLTKIKLINCKDEPVNCDLAIKEADLLTYLKSRIQQGIQNFFIEMKRSFACPEAQQLLQPQLANNQKSDSNGVQGAFEKKHSNATVTTILPDLIHVLLAGNASRSRITLGLFGISDDEVAKKLQDIGNKELSASFGDAIPKLKIHLPLLADDKDPYKPTAKTGVALGLLRLCPGESLKVINHAQNEAEESPFQFFVGTVKRGFFDASIKRGVNYHQWYELGIVREGVFALLYSSAPRAQTGTMQRGDIELVEKKLPVAGALTGHKVFARAISPNEIEVCTAASLADTSAKVLNNLQMLKLA